MQLQGSDISAPTDLGQLAIDLAASTSDGRFDALKDNDKARAIALMKELNRRRAVPLYDRMYPDSGPFARFRYRKHLEFYEAGATYMERCMMGGNRVGKTVVGAYETTAHLTGMYKDWWPGHRFREPVDVWTCGKTGDTLKRINQHALFGGLRKVRGGRFEIRGTGMIPADRIVYESTIMKEGFSGLVGFVEIRYRDSLHETSQLTFMAYAQKRSAFEGAEVDLLHLDEEPAWDIYSECMMRIGNSRGKSMLTFTPMEGHTEVVEGFLATSLVPAALDPMYTEF